MNGYCISDSYCQYKSDTGYCGYSAGCVKEVGTVKTISMSPSKIVHVVDISEDSINAIADAVVERLRGRG